MIISKNFEVVNVAGEVLAVPVGDFAKKCKEVYTFSNAGAYLLQIMKAPVTFEELVTKLTSEYDLEKDVAYKDVQWFINELLLLGLVDQ